MSTSRVGAIAVRRAQTDDAAMLTELGARTFLETFGPDNRPEHMAAHLARTFSLAIQARELVDPALTFLIAESDAASAGYALLAAGHAPAAASAVPPASIEVSRFYVDRPWQGTGTARALMDACVTHAREQGAPALWLGVWERNPRAIRFYEKCGFRDIGSQRFMLGDDPQTDRVMMMTLAPGS